MTAKQISTNNLSCEHNLVLSKAILFLDLSEGANRLSLNIFGSNRFHRHPPPTQPKALSQSRLNPQQKPMEHI